MYLKVAIFQATMSYSIYALWRGDQLELPVSYFSPFCVLDL